jgi:hypothetical protein
VLAISESAFRTCFGCKQTKQVTQFYRSNTRYYQRECKDCNRERKYRWHHTEHGKRSTRNTKLKNRFGITVEQYESIHRDQGGKCLICTAELSYMGHRLAVDHDHKTGKIRGLLCKGCNTGIGNLKDDPALLRKAAEYLEKINGVNAGH